MTTKIAAWKGLHSGQPMLHKSYDATNAFASGQKHQLEQCVHDRLAEEEEELADEDIRYATTVTRTRRRNLTVIIDAADVRCA
eukprot:3280621-Pyramimonas_sp.AAC.1